MRPTDELHFVAEAHGIILRRYEIPDGRKGLYIYPDDPPAPHIVIPPDVREGSLAYRAILAHELGHYFTLARDYSLIENELDKALGNRWENRADRWAIHFMVRTGSLWALWHNRYTTWEIADMLVVPEEWVIKKLQWLGHFN